MAPTLSGSHGTDVPPLPWCPAAAAIQIPAGRRCRRLENGCPGGNGVVWCGGGSGFSDLPASYGRDTASPGARPWEEVPAEHAGGAQPRRVRGVPGRREPRELLPLCLRAPEARPAPAAPAAAALRTARLLLPAGHAGGRAAEPWWGGGWGGRLKVRLGLPV